MSIAFPCGIGCGLGGGDWKRYGKTIIDFAKLNEDVEVYVVRWGKGDPNAPDDMALVAGAEPEADVPDDRPTAIPVNHGSFNPVHIQQEINDIRRKDIAGYYRDITCDVLILKATQGFLCDDDRLLPQDAVTEMLNVIPRSQEMAVEGTNHFSILFDRHDARDNALSSFLQ